eukprot:Hpha_TRINITY_DN10557_c0_g1::TRINITY_DN10557_c0_g1_i1::g.31450::m.31450
MAASDTDPLAPQGALPFPLAPPCPRTVNTPWYPRGIPVEELSFAGELRAFASLVGLMPSEHADRRFHVQTLAGVVRGVFGPQCWLRVYGSTACDLCDFTSGVDTVVEGPWDPSGFPSYLSRVREAGFTVVIFSPPGGDIPSACAELHTATGLRIFMSFQKRSRALEVTRTVSGLLQVYTSVRPALFVARALLRQSKCGVPSEGGLSSFAVLLMLLFLARQARPPGRADHLLLDFLSTFGGDEGMPAICGPHEEPPARHPCTLWISDPFDSRINVAAGCTKLPKIRALFRHAAISFHRWLLQKHGGAVHRGRTALSSVVAMRDLWPRSHAVFGDAQATPEPAKEPTAETFQPPAVWASAPANPPPSFGLFQPPPVVCDPSTQGAAGAPASELTTESFVPPPVWARSFSSEAATSSQGLSTSSQGLSTSYYSELSTISSSHHSTGGRKASNP